MKCRGRAGRSTASETGRVYAWSGKERPARQVQTGFGRARQARTGPSTPGIDRLITASKTSYVRVERGEASTVCCGESHPSVVPRVEASVECPVTVTRGLVQPARLVRARPGRASVSRPLSAELGLERCGQRDQARHGTVSQRRASQGKHGEASHGRKRMVGPARRVKTRYAFACHGWPVLTTQVLSECG
jgi:hypothetical protein